MNKREEKARELKSDGMLCSNALFEVFKEEVGQDLIPPLPRSIDGKCGAVLTTEFILNKLNKSDYIDEYNKIFEEKFGSLKCFDLMKKDRRCSDYVGESARFISNLLK